MVAHYSRNDWDRAVSSVVGAKLPGRPVQGTGAVSTVKNYEIGSRLALGGRVFHYAKSGGVLTPNMGAKIKNPQDVSQEVLGAAAVAGATSIVLKLDNTDGPTYDGLLPANYLAGGYVVVFPAGDPAFVRGIISHTAVTVNAGTASFTALLDAPIPCDLTIADVAEAMASPYALVVPNTATKLTDNLTTTIGVPACPAISGDHLWLQTWGPCWVSPHAAVGALASNKAAYFVGDGALGEGQETTGIADKIAVIGQYAGFVLANDKGGGQGAPFVMLMIDP